MHKLLTGPSRFLLKNLIELVVITKTRAHWKVLVVLYPLKI